MSYTCLFCHIVFSTKERRQFLKDDLVQRTCQYIGGIARNLRGEILLGGGQPDHLHLAAVLPATLAMAEYVGTLKSNSSGWIHDTFTELAGFAWQDGYAAFAVSPSVMPAVKKYILAQAEHHRKITFQEELIALLKKHGVKYDERYIGS